MSLFEAPPRRGAGSCACSSKPGGGGCCGSKPSSPQSGGGCCGNRNASPISASPYESNESKPQRKFPPRPPTPSTSRHSRNFACGPNFIDDDYEPTPQPITTVASVSVAKQPKKTISRTSYGSDSEDDFLNKTPVKSMMEEVRYLIYDKLDPIKNLAEDMVVVKEQMQELRTAVATMKKGLLECSDQTSLLESRLQRVDRTKDELYFMKFTLDKLQDDDRDGYSPAKMIEIKGVPYHDEEDLYEILLKICMLAGCHVEKDQLTFICRESTRSKRPQNIVICFNERAVKDEFVHAVQELKDLTTKDLGYYEHNKIYVI